MAVMTLPVASPSTKGRVAVGLVWRILPRILVSQSFSFSRPWYSALTDNLVGDMACSGGARGLDANLHDAGMADARKRDNAD